LPVHIEFISGEGSIDDTIRNLIRGQNPRNHPLKILCNQYTTLLKHHEEVIQRKQHSEIKIIGSEIPLEGDLQRIFEDLNAHQINVCMGTFDGIRVILDGDSRLLVSFATAGYEKSHVGIYSEHPFLVALFKTYFDTKCSALNCQNSDCLKIG